MSKTLGKNSDSKNNKNQLKKLYITILSQKSEKNEKLTIFSENFVKKNCESDVECIEADYKNQKIPKKFKSNSEKNEFSKSAEISINKIEFKIRREKICNYAKDEKNNMNEHLEEYISQENENKYNRKNNKLDKNEIYKNMSNEYYDDIKYNKKLKLNENIINKCKLKIKIY